MSIFIGGLSHKYVFFMYVYSQFHFVVLKMLFPLKKNFFVALLISFVLMNWTMGSIEISAVGL